MAVVHTPGHGRTYLAVGTPRQRPVSACQGGREDIRQAARPGHGRVAVLRLPGLGRSYLGVGTPRPQPLRACRRGREDTTQATHPGCNRSAHAGAGEKLLGGCDAPAAAVPCLPGRAGGRTGDMHAPAAAVFRTPRRGRHNLALGRPGCSRSALAGAEEKPPSRRVVPSGNGPRQPWRERERTGVRSTSGLMAGWSPGPHPAASLRRGTNRRVAGGQAPLAYGSWRVLWSVSDTKALLLSAAVGVTLGMGQAIQLLLRGRRLKGAVDCCYAGPPVRGALKPFQAGGRC